MKRHIINIGMSLLLLGTVPLRAQGHHLAFQRVTFQLDNDTFFETDRQYTNGLRLIWSSGRLDRFSDHPLVPQFLDRAACAVIPQNESMVPKRWVSTFVGQNIYTPDNLREEALIKDDRPYAGLLYMGLGFYQEQGATHYGCRVMLGWVGPHSLGEAAMEGMHSRYDWPYPHGWVNQLKDEPIVDLGLQWKYKYQWPDVEAGWGTAWMPFAGVSLGNGYSGLSGGLEFMWGSPNTGDFGLANALPYGGATPPSIQFSSRKNWGIALFGAVTGNWVWRNILLDGNTWVSSHHVEKEPLTAKMMSGLAIKMRDLLITFSHVYQTREFVKQRKIHSYGMLALTFNP